MGIFHYLFWTSLIALAYTYLGYMIILFVIVLFKKNIKTVQSENSNDVTLIIPAYNEGFILQDKIDNCLELGRAFGKLKIVFCIDGSTDNSVEILQKYPNIKVHYSEIRKGKMSAINNAMKEVNTPFIIFSDANTLLHKTSITELVKHFNNKKIGAIAGEKRVLFTTNTIVGLGEGYYWKYESFLKLLNSKLYSVVGAAGELFCMRTKLFTELPEDTILDDFMLCMEVIKKGYQVVYEPNAIAIESPSVNIEEESKRRIRIAAGSFQALSRLSISFPFLKFPIFSFQFFSQKFCRWVISPLALIVLFIASVILYSNETSFIQYFIKAQFLFYGIAFIGFVLNKYFKRNFIFFSVPYYFVFMHVSLIFGFIKFYQGKQSTQWEKAVRE